MRVSSVTLGGGAVHVPKAGAEPALSEFAFLPKQNQNKSIFSKSGLLKLLVGLGAIAVAITLSRVKMPFKKHTIDALDFLC